MPQESTVLRPVLSRDPGLSAEANRLLTGELRAVIGADEIRVPESWPDHAGERHATHGSYVATAIMMRLVWGFVAIMLVMTALIAVIATTSSWALLAVVAALLVPSVGFVAMMVSRMYDEPEHLDPELSAMLIEEGVGDPDRTFTDLVHDFRPPRGGVALPH